MDTIQLEVHGMSCGSCVDNVSRQLRRIEGVDQVSVDLQHGRVSVTGNFPQSGAGPLVAALETVGFPARVVTADSSRAATAAPVDRAKGGGCCGGNRQGTG